MTAQSFVGQQALVSDGNGTDAEEATVDVGAQETKETGVSFFDGAESWLKSCWPSSGDSDEETGNYIEGRNEIDGGNFESKAGNRNALGQTSKEERESLSEGQRPDKSPASSGLSSVTLRARTISFPIDGTDREDEVSTTSSEKADPFANFIASMPSAGENGGQHVEITEERKAYKRSSSRFKMKCRVPDNMSIPFKQVKQMHNKTIEENDDILRKDHITNLKSVIRSHGRYDTKVADVLVNMAEFYNRLSDYKQAQDLHKEALAIYRTKLGDFSLRCIDTKIRIAHSHVLQGEFEEAMDVLSHAMEMRRSLLGESHASVLEVRTHLADVLRRKGQTKEAVKEAKRALKGYRDVYGDEHPSVCSAVEDIAALYAEMGDHEKANNILAEVVKLRIAIDGNGHKNVADALMNWAWSFDAIGNHTKAMKTMKQAYTAYVELEGEFGSSVMKALDAIGRLYSKMGQHDKAIKSHTRVLTIKKQTLGNESLETASSYVAVGCALNEIDESERAAKCMKRANDIYQKSFQDISDSASVADTVHCVGLSFKISGDHDEALKAFSREIAIRRMAGGKQHQLATASALNAMGQVHCKRNSAEDAMDCFSKALEIQDELEGRKSAFADFLFNAGVALQQMGKLDDACQAYAEAVLIYKAQLTDRLCGDPSARPEHRFTRAESRSEESTETMRTELRWSSS